jgi:hypothetical protein
MPTVKRFARCRIEMYFGDHPPPHFHVITRADERAAVRIDTLQVWAGEADPRDLTEALSWAAENRAALWSRWQAYSEVDT